jgi:hypothetical protein
MVYIAFFDRHFIYANTYIFHVSKEFLLNLLFNVSTLQ